MTSEERQVTGLLGAEAFGHSSHEVETDKQRLDPLRNLSSPDRARFHVMMYVNAQREKVGHKRIKFREEDVKLVWFCKVLKNWKALVITTLPDLMYYEITYNGDNGETYIDAYQKLENVCV